MTIQSDLSLDFVSLRSAYANGATPAQIIRLVFSRIAAADDPGIFISLFPEHHCLEMAARLGPFDPSKPLYGMPFAIKDNIDVQGLPTTAACPDFTYEPGEHAFAVRLLLEAGAIPVGKTNLDQFATGLVGVRSPWPAPKNSFDSSMVPGGSSSGSAVAVARGLVSFALGTDTAGSGRVPAALNNIVGLKPSLGMISATGVVPACRTLDTISIFALTTDDAFDALRVASRFDAQDAFARPLAPGALGPIPQTLRIGVPNRAGRVFGGDSQAEASFDQAIRQMTAAGATIVDVDMDGFFETARLLYEGPWVAERYHATRKIMDASPASLLPVTRKIIESAKNFTAVDMFDATYKLASLRRRTRQIWASIDALMTPTYPRPLRIAELADDPIGPNSELGAYTNFVNLLDLCGIAVPAPLRDDGFPSGVTFLAPAGKDAQLAGIASSFHYASNVTLGATGAHMPPPTNRPDIALPGEIEIAVVGAHLSGMALNRELRDLDARFLRAVSTLPTYRFYALPGGPPFRPGLLRVTHGGAAIATEVWAMTKDAFGTFVAGIPAPLGIGALQLADGTTPKGFLVEAFAIEGAEDISHHGGWRAYMAARES